MHEKREPLHEALASARLDFRADAPVAEVAADNEEGGRILPVLLQSLVDLVHGPLGRMPHQDGHELQVVTSERSAHVTCAKASGR